MIREAEHQGVPWHVDGLPVVTEAADVKGWRYVVVEEIVDAVAVLRRWRWPSADELGHLVWLDDVQEDATTVPVEVLRTQLYTPNALERDPRVGDTFAMVADTAPTHWPRRTRNLGRVFSGRVFDVSAEARLAARLAYQGSLAAIAPAEQMTTGTDIVDDGRPRRFAAPELTVAASASGAAP